MTNLNRSAPVPVDDYLSLGQSADVASLQQRFAHVFSPLPGRLRVSDIWLPAPEKQAFLSPQSNRVEPGVVWGWVGE